MPPMEKLQKALNKARQERGAAEGLDGGARSPARPAAGSARDPVGVWPRLAPFEPDPSLLARNRVMTLNAHVDGRPFDMLRTKIFLMMREQGWTRLAVISPDKGCGKTTTACNLAVGFSRQQEIRTMLFDFDLRRPGISATLGLDPPHEVRDVLLRTVSPDEQMLRLRGNVAISAARRPVADPTQLLLSKGTSEVLDDIQARYAPDIMIFDLPPMLVTDDARAMLKNVDCALILARAEHTKMSHLDVCEREVGEYTNVLGVVLNSCRHMPSEEGNYGDYA